MKCKLFTRCSSAIFALLACFNVQGQGTAFTYQGILKQDGFAAYGTYDFQFSVYGSDIGGAPLSPLLLINGVVVSNGLFTVILDFGTGIFNGPPRWLQMGVKTNASPDPYTVLSPRQPLTAAPYAIFSGNATTTPWSGITGLPASFADGVDNDTTYIAGAGLTLSGTTFSLNEAVTDGLYWRLGGNGGTIPGTHFLGTTDEQPLEFHLNNSRVLRLEYVNVSPNFIGGYPFNTIAANLSGAYIGSGGRAAQINHVSADYAAIVSGYANTASAEGAFIGGGAGNQAAGTNAVIGGGDANANVGNFSVIAGGQSNSIPIFGRWSAIGGGFSNTVLWPWVTIGGGEQNTAIGFYAVIGGGRKNFTGEQGATVGGGGDNRAEGHHSTVSGGNRNTAASFGSTVAGGSVNFATAVNSSVGGGTLNISSGEYTTIPGGRGNQAAGNYAFAAGRRARANHLGSFVWADSTDADFTSTIANQVSLRAGGGVRVVTSGAGMTLDGESVLSGMVESSELGGTYSNPLTFNNPANSFTGSFSGNGSGLNNVNASTLGGFGPLNFWQVGGNNLSPGQFLGSVNNQPLEFRANNTRALRLEPAGGLPNIVAGSPMNFVVGGLNSATIGGGHFNILSNVAHSATIAGGSNNAAGGYASFVGGGIANEAQGTNSTIAGGAFNKVLQAYGTVGGGMANYAVEPGDTVAGGRGNTAEGVDSTVGGGFVNLAIGYISTVGGGQGNTARGANSVIAGGASNDIGDAADHSVIGGGVANEATRQAKYASIGGGLWNVVSNDFSTVGGGTTNRALADGSTVAGGVQNSVRAVYSSIGGGYSNRVDAWDSVVAGGAYNHVQADAQWGTIGGGIANFVNNDLTTIGGGGLNTNNGLSGTISGGRENLIAAGTIAASISGGYSNRIQGGWSGTIPGGDQNEVAEEHGFAAGHRAKSRHLGAFVWADSSDADHISTRPNQFSVRAHGGVAITSTNVALELASTGSINVAGAGVGSSTPVFIHRATAANISGNFTRIDHPHCNGNPNAILIVTPNWNPGGVGAVYNNHAIGVFYDNSGSAPRWAIFNQDSVAMPVGAAFNVLVVKP